MKLDHIQLAMPRGGENAARYFFVELLGFFEEVKPRPLDERGGCWFRLDSVIVHIGVDEDFIPQRKAHPAFIVENIDVMARLLAESSCPISWDASLPDRKRFFTEDPFGNRLEFLAAGDGFSEK